MNILKFDAGDVVEVKKKHPCGSNLFLIARTGSEVRMICRGCERDITVDRLKAEKFIKRVLSVDGSK